MKKLNYDFLEGAKKMPPLYHTFPGKDFDIEKSEVASWIMEKPEVAQKVFNMAVNQKLIKYDKRTGKWQGVDYAD